MTERDFIYWLNGFLESGINNELNEAQVKTIKDHLRMVTDKLTPDNYTSVELSGTAMFC
jgi:hypothetical protein